MKKFLAILLAMVLVLVNVAAVMAEDGGGEGEGGEASTPAYNPSEGIFSQDHPLTGTTFTIDKKYTLTVGANAKLPADEISYSAELVNIFKSTISSFEKTDFPVSFDTSALNTAMKDKAVSGTSELFEEKITITLPAYTKVGIYQYEVKETGKDAAGVTYTDDTVYMKVTVINKDPSDPTKGVVVAGISFRKEKDTEDVHDDKKLGELSNDYKSGALKLEKEVTGNMGEVDRDFTFTIVLTSTKDVYSKITYETTGNGAVTAAAGTGVTLNTSGKTIDAGTAGWKSATITATLRDTDTVTFYNIPDGVTYTIAEAAEDGYTTTGTVDTAKAITPAAVAEEKVTNDKNIEIDTGIALDTVPYFMILALVMAGAVMMVIRKREEY